MKKSFFYFAALSLWCMASLSSCVKEAVMTDSAETTQATIKLTLTGSAGTRASGTSEPTGEDKINSLVVGFFDANEKVISIQSKTDYSSNPATEEFKLSLPVNGLSGCTAVAVANAPTTTMTALTKCVTKSDFLASTVGLSDAQSSSYLPMSGDVKANSATSFTLTGGITNYLSVDLVRMVARIMLTSLKTNFSAPYQGVATVKLQRVFLRNAISTALVNPTFTMPGSLSAASYLTGGGTWTTGSPGSWSGENSYLFNDLKGSEVLVDGSTVLPGSKYHYFYAFANDASLSGAQETAFVIQALFDADGSSGSASEETVFYPVIIGKNGTSKGLISRNTKYSLGVSIKSKGASSPDATIEDGAITLTVSVKSWADAPQNVEF